MICGFSHLLARLCFVFVSIFLIIFFVLIVPVGLFRVDCFFCFFIMCAVFVCSSCFVREYRNCYECVSDGVFFYIWARIPLSRMLHVIGVVI